MKNGFFKTTASAMCLAFLLLSAALAPASQTRASKTLPGHVPRAVAKLALAPVMRLPQTNIIRLAIGLPLRNQDQLDALLQSVYDPASPNYRHFLTPDKFAAQFGPTEQDYQKVINFARTSGFVVVGTTSNRTLLYVTATAGDIEKAFHVQMRSYQHPKEARQFYAPNTEPTLDSTLPVLSICGLNNYSLARPLHHENKSPGKSFGSFATGSSPSGSYWGYDFRKAYAPGVKLTGTGQSVALFEQDGYYANDVSSYLTASGLPSVPLSNVAVGGFNGQPSGTGGEIEVALDIDMAISMAPGLSKVIVYEGPGDSPVYNLEVLNRIATDNLAQQISSSWLIDDSLTNFAQVYIQFAMQGQSFFQASGDSGAYYPGIFQFEDSPLVTLVGGTTLTATGIGGTWAFEQVWNNGYDPLAGHEWASGGGVSTVYSIPSWQTNINMTASKGSTTNRNVPDVALTADNIYIWGDGSPISDEGGTSAAAPLWAGFMALVNQQAAANGSPPLGFINPAIYSLAQGPNYTNLFHDIVTGNNTNLVSTNLFYAVPGYDLCTGLGTPNGSALIYALAGRAPRTGFLQLTVNPSSGSTLLNATAQPVTVTVNDGGYDVTNATVTASIPLVFTNLTLSNASVPPGPVYSNAFLVPASGSSLTMTVVANATGEIGATNVIYYSVVPAPPNDNFSNATKVPVGGATYLANNRFATLEANEPQHDGDASVAASLWWQWTPLTSTNVFIDTIGSKVENVLAVYTNSTLVTLKAVAATNSNLAQFEPAFLGFNARAGVTYRIAVASYTPNSAGSLVLHITPGGQLDTTPPLVSVTSPLSGLTVTNRGILILGTATDPSPNASGVSQVTVSANGIATTATGTTNWTAPVALSPNLNIIQVTAVDAAGNSSSPAAIQVNYLVPPVANDFFVNATNFPLSGASGVVSNSNVNATREVGEPNHAGNPGGKSIWWSFTATNDGVLTLNTTNSTFDTLLGLYTGTNVANLTTIADNDDAYPGVPGGFSLISQAVSSNQVYDVAVDGFDGASGEVYLHYSFVPTTNYNLTVSITNLTVTNTPGGTVQVTTVNALGGTSIMPGPSGVFAAGANVTLTALPNASSQFNKWTGGVSSSNNPLTLVVQSDLTLTANFVALPFTDGFESGDLSHLSWITTGDAPWFVQTDIADQGHWAARSGVITDSQTSSLILTANFTSGIGSFDYKVSSETNWDFLNFYVDGVLQQQWSGEVGWANYSFSLTNGQHTLEWTYVKDASFSSGLDAAFIDDLYLPINSPMMLQIQSQLISGGSLQMTLTGQTGKQYSIQATTNLLSPNWVNVYTGTVPFTYICPGYTTNRQQYFRAKSL